MMRRDHHLLTSNMFQMNFNIESHFKKPHSCFILQSGESLCSYKSLSCSLMFSFCRNLKKCLRVGNVKTGSWIVNRNLSSRNMNVADLTLYGDYASPPVRFVLVTAKLLKAQLKFHDIDLFKSENKSEFYKKINPLQKVPALAVGDTVIRDSHAIALYLCRRNSQQDLYPNDALLRAQVDEILYFNATILFPIDSEICSGPFLGKWPPEESTLYKWYNAIDYLGSKLKLNKFLAGEKMLLCDLCCHQTIISVGIVARPILERHGRVKEWMQTIQNNLPCNDINKRGLDRFKNAIKQVGIVLDS